MDSDCTPLADADEGRFDPFFPQRRLHADEPLGVVDDGRQAFLRAVVRLQPEVSTTLLRGPLDAFRVLFDRVYADLSAEQAWIAAAVDDWTWKRLERQAETSDEAARAVEAILAWARRWGLGQSDDDWTLDTAVHNLLLGVHRTDDATANDVSVLLYLPRAMNQVPEVEPRAPGVPAWQPQQTSWRAYEQHVIAKKSNHGIGRSELRAYARRTEAELSDAGFRRVSLPRARKGDRYTWLAMRIVERKSLGSIHQELAKAARIETLRYGARGTSNPESPATREAIFQAIRKTSKEVGINIPHLPAGRRRKQARVIRLSTSPQGKNARHA